MTAFVARRLVGVLPVILGVSIVIFLLVHVVMIFVAGFRSRMRAMITGRAGTDLD